MARQQPQAYAWPSLLHRQEAHLRLVYLDLNHGISLAKAAKGHRDGDRHKGALEAVRDVSSAGTALSPLSATHYMEMSGIQDPRQRADIADVMEELSGFTTLINRTILMRYEIEAALDEMLEAPPPGSTPSHSAAEASAPPSASTAAYASNRRTAGT